MQSYINIVYVNPVCINVLSVLMDNAESTVRHLNFFLMKVKTKACRGCY